MFSFVIGWVRGFLSNSSSFHNTHLPFTRTVCVSSCRGRGTGRRRDGDAAPPRCPSDRTPSRDNDVGVGGTGNDDGEKSGAERASSEEERESKRGRRPRFYRRRRLQLLRRRPASDDILILPSAQTSAASKRKGREARGGVPARPLLSVAVWDSMTDGLDGLKGLDGGRDSG